jgi:redox-sensitive bicupin YhaK (pirin superfamily)
MPPIRVRSQLRDLGEGFHVRRLLPDIALRTVGPFVFFDHMGPADFTPGHGMDVRPHPHIGLATVTWLFEGSIRHRDGLGSVVDIEPGAVNWMIAGRGIVHSERTPPDVRAAGHRLHGIQTWVALPRADEAMAPAFVHVPAADVPVREGAGSRVSVVAGDAWDLRSPVPVRSRTLYLMVELAGGAELALPEDHAERAVYCAAGRIEVAGEVVAEGELLRLADGPARLRADAPALVVVLGGDALDPGPENTPTQPRHLRWNFVASNRADLDAATAAWSRQDPLAFPPVPGETEFIPWPPA